MSMTSPLDDVVEKGRRHYYKGESFKRWSQIVVQKYGDGVSPYLEDAWTVIEASAKRERETGQKATQIGRQTDDAGGVVASAVHTSKEPIVLDGWFLPFFQGLDRWFARTFRGSETGTSGKASPIGRQEADSKSSTLYRMVAPGRFAPIPKEPIAAKLRNLARSRKAIVAITALAFVLAGLFPPWLHTYDGPAGHARSDAGYAFMLSLPLPKGIPERYGVQLDTSRLLIEWACILVFSGAAWFVCGAFRQRQDGDGPS